MTKSSVHQNVRQFLWEKLLAFAEWIGTILFTDASARTSVADLVSHLARERIPVCMGHVLIIDHCDENALQALAEAGASTISVVGNPEMLSEPEGVRIIRYQPPLSQLALDPLSLPTLVILGSSSALGADCSHRWVADLPTGTVIVCQDLYPLLTGDEEALVVMYGYGTSQTAYQLQYSVYELHNLVLVSAEATRTGILRKV